MIFCHVSVEVKLWLWCSLPACSSWVCFNRIQYEKTKR